MTHLAAPQPRGTTAHSTEKLDAFARKHGVTPEQFRTMTVREFTRDIAAEIGKFIDAAERLDEFLSLVTPQRGHRFALTLVPCYEALLDVKQYLERLALDPMAWPEYQ